MPLTVDVSYTCKVYLKDFRFRLTATEKDKVKTSILLTCFVQKRKETYETFTLDSTDHETTLDLLWINSPSTAPQGKILPLSVINFSSIDRLDAKFYMNSLPA